MYELQILLSQLFHYSASASLSNYKDCLHYTYVFFERLLAAKFGEMFDKSYFLRKRIYL